MGSDAVAITDHNEVNQHFAFQKACRAEGIHPILGIEADWVYDVAWTRANLKRYPSNKSHICLLAENNTGLSNIWALASLAYTDKYRFHKPLITPELMREYREGVYASDGCMLTELGRCVERDDIDLARQHFSALLDVFGDHFYSELHTWQFIDADTPRKRYLNNLMTKINQVKVQFANEMGVPLVIVNDSHHAHPEDWELKELVWEFNTHRRKGDDRDDGGDYGQKADHLMGNQELYLWMERHGVPDEIVDEAVRNAEHIAGTCTAEIRRTMEMPRLSQSEAEDLHTLMAKVRKGFKEKVDDRGLDHDTYYQRLEEELDLIASKSFAGYFNVEQDLVDAATSGRWAPYVRAGAAKAPMLVGPGRGSAGGCLVAYLLGITSIDPIHYGLIFERFLDPSRMDNPDIDVDFPQSMRADAKSYLEARYGHDHVCTIGTLSRSQPKQVLRDLARTMPEVDPTHVNQMSRIIDQVSLIETEVDEGVDGPSWEEVLDAKGGELSEWRRMYPQLFRKLNEMVGMVRQSGRHASGVLVSNRPVLGTIPTRTRDGAPDAITQFDMYEVEELGGVKLDLLGLRHLDTLMHARSLIYQRHGEWLDFHSFGYDRFRDPAIWGAIARGHTVGIFQLETPDLTRHAQQLQPRNEVDVAALISIVRPGVKDAGLGQIYLDRRAEKIPVEYDHPLMVDITKETYGVLVYQEQLMETAKKLAGFTGAEANALRRALGKKKMADVMGFKEQFITSCLEIDNNPVRALKMAEKIWTSIEAAGRYAFNKSHAVGYALISTWEVWVKHYYPEEFLAALLATDGDNVNRYVREARRMKFEVLPPDINESGRKFTLGPVGSKQIRYGLQSIHGLGAVACKQIDSGRPYRDFSDYLKRGGKKGADKTAAYNLACLGAFDSLATRDQVLDLLERERAKEGLAPSTLENPDKLDVVLARRLSTDHYKIPRPDFSDRKVIYEIEKELCGSYITEDPLASYLTVIRKTCLADPAEMKEFKRGHKFCIGGQLTQIRPVVVQKKGRYYGREMAFLTIQWNELDFEVTAFPGIWADSRDLIHVGDAVGCDVESDARGCHLINIYLLDQLKEEFGAKG